MAILAFDREDMVMAALAALMVAGLVITVGGLLLLRRERRGRTRSEESPDASPGA